MITLSIETPILKSADEAMTLIDQTSSCRGYSDKPLGLDLTVHADEGVVTKGSRVSLRQHGQVTSIAGIL